MSSRVRALPLCWRYRRYYALGGLSLTITNLCDAALPLVLQLAVDDVVLARGLLPIWAIALGYLALVLLLGLFRYVWRYFFLGASHRIATELRARLFAHFCRLSPSFFQRSFTGELMSRATNDLNSARELFALGMLLTLDTFMYLLIIPPAMIWISPQLSLYTLIPLLVIPGFMWAMGRVVHARFTAVQERFGEMSAAVEETFAGVRVVKGYAQEEHRLATLRALNERSIRDSLRLAIAQGLLQPSISLLMTAALVAVVILGGRMAIDGAITVGGFVAFQHYLLKLGWPLRAIGFTVNIFERGLASLARLDEVFAEAPDIADGPHTRPGLEVRAGAVEVRGLTFTYPERADPIAQQDAGARAGRGTGAGAGAGGGASPPAGADAALRPPALTGISLTIAAGETVALVGPVGAGKSTLLSLLPRLFDAEPGRIRLDGHDLREYPLASLRGAIGYVPQETFLFADSIAANVAFGVPEAPAEAIREACERAGVIADIEALPQGFASMLGERGVNLSGGQRQRVAIARAILQKPRLLLLDDCLSAVDTETEAAILRGLRLERRGRTTLIASHRLQAVRDADRIVCLDRGRVVETGTHDDLLAAGGLYARLWEHQQLERRVDAAL